MRHVLLYSLSLLLCSCVVGSEITVHPDNSATVTQNYLESPSYPEYKQDSLGFRDTREERKKYDTPTISNFKDIYGAMFSVDISSIDSLPNYLSGFPDNCLRINTFGDSLFVFRVSPAEEKPKAFYDYYSNLLLTFP